MTKKVIYISFMRLSKKAARDWYVDYLIAQGTDVEYWDVTSLLFGEDSHSSMQTAYLRTPRSYKEIEALLRLPENTTARYIMLVTYEGRTTKLYRLLSQYGCRMYFIAWGALPINYDNSWKNILIRIFSNPAKFVQATYNRIISATYIKLGLVKPYDVVFCAGQVLVAGNHFATRVVPINLVDYDHFARVRSEEGRVVKGRYAVFLDINLPYQSDLKIVGLRAIEVKEYYSALNHFFKLLEDKYGIKVVIAAHPKAKYSNELFQGREIYQGMTPELVRDAEFVISHHSTSISYAVLNRKPIVFVYTDEMATVYERTIVNYEHAFADYLDAKIYNIDEISQAGQIAIGDVGDERYEAYKYNYLTTHESEQTSTQEIFWREINAR